MTDEELINALYEQLIEKRLSILQALKAINYARSAFYRRLGTDPALAKSISEIRACQAELLADELFEIADNPKLHPAHRNAMIDTRKWYLSKIVPRFKDKQEIEHKGLPETLTDDERAKRIATLLDKGRERGAGQAPGGKAEAEPS